MNTEYQIREVRRDIFWMTLTLTPETLTQDKHWWNIWLVRSDDWWNKNFWTMQPGLAKTQCHTTQHCFNLKWPEWWLICLNCLCEFMWRRKYYYCNSAIYYLFSETRPAPVWSLSAAHTRNSGAAPSSRQCIRTKWIDFFEIKHIILHLSIIANLLSGLHCTSLVHFEIHGLIKCHYDIMR